MPLRSHDYVGYTLFWQSIPPREIAAVVTDERWLAWSADPAFKAVSELLLGIAGEMVVPPRCMPPDRFQNAEMQRVTQKGRFFPGTPVCTMPGDPSRCHANVCRLWTKGVAIAITTGYALSDDGRWREHTWGVARRRMRCGDIDTIDAGDVVETTETRVCYFGYMLNRVMANGFVRANM